MNLVINIAQSLGATVISFIIAITTLSGLSSILDFRSSIQGDDFEMSDVYNYVADNRVVSHLSSDVTILSLDGCDRDDIAKLIPMIDSLNPSVIGLDVLFHQDFEGDDALINALNNSSNIVLPVLFEEETQAFIGSYFYEQIENARYGVINLNASSNNQPIRSFTPSVTCNNLTINTFAVELTSVANRDKYTEYINRQSTVETISYPSTEFFTIKYLDFIGSPEAFSEYIKNKIVLLGDTEQVNDLHITPISVNTPGVKIHAHIIDTILNGKYITVSPSWLNWALGFLLCFLLILVNYTIWDRVPLLCNIVTRVIQVICLYCFFAIGCKVFVGSHYYIDFSPALLMIGFGLFAYDLWVGIVAVFQLIFKKRKA